MPPTEAPQEGRLAGVTALAGLTRFRPVGEPSAAALGGGAHAHAQLGDVYAIFDSGGGMVGIAVTSLWGCLSPTMFARRWRKESDVCVSLEMDR